MTEEMKCEAPEGTETFEKQSKRMSAEEKKAMEQALRESEETYRFLIEESNDIIWKFDLSTMSYTYGSNSLERILGYPPEMATGFTLDDIFTPETKKEVLTTFGNVVAGRAGSNRVLLEAEHRHRNGHYVWMEINAVLHKDSMNQPAAFTGVSRDISDRKRAEAESETLHAQLRRAQKMQALGTLTGGVAHDFNNILSIIMGYTELVQDEVPEGTPIRNWLNEIRSASLRARDVVRHLLTFSRRGEEMQAVTDICLIIKEAMRMMHSTLPSSVEIRECITGSRQLIMADSTQIHQVIVNLCKNASDAMAEKGGVLSVLLERVSLSEGEMAFDPDLSPGDFVKLTVQDTGHGIPSEHLERIFDPYFTTRDVDKGTGLGLSVVLGIVKGHGGAIRVVSEVDRGTTFEVFFPVAGEVPNQYRAATENELPRGSERILFIDDEESVVRINRLRLEKLGYHVTGITAPDNALEVFRADPDQFDLIITDMTMPKMTGDDLARGILKIRPDMKIILCTGYSEKISKDSIKAAGIARCIEKPIEMQTLAGSVRAVLDS